MITATNYNHSELGGVTESRLEEGFWMLPAKERGAGFLNSSSEVFSYAFLVRDDVAEDIEGRLRVEGDPVRGDGTVRMSSFALELSEAPAMAAVCGSTGQYGSGRCLVYPEAVPEGCRRSGFFFWLRAFRETDSACISSRWNLAE